MKQVIISVGKRHEPALAVVIDDYTARLNRELPTAWQFVKPSGADAATARRLESAEVQTLLRPDDFVVLCDERGQELSSVAFAAQYGDWLSRHQRLVFVIGGAYGVDASLTERANVVWRLSPLVFPHQLVRLIIVEQLYRARMIAKNHPYHHS